MKALFREFVIARQRAEDRSDRSITLAWQIEAMRRQGKKLPSLRSLLARTKQRAQSVNEQREMLHLLSQQYGGPVRKAQPKVTSGR